MKNKWLSSTFKETYLNHLNTPSALEYGQRKNQSVPKTVPRRLRPRNLPPISRSKSPEQLRLKNEDLQHQYEEIIKLFSIKSKEKNQKKIGSNK